MSGLDKDLVDLKLNWIEGNQSKIDSYVLDRLKELAPCFIVHMKSGAIMFCSRKVNDLFGYLYNELENQKIDILIPERLRQKHAAHLMNFADKPHYRQMGAHGQTLTGLKKDGSEFSIKISLEPFYQNSVGYVFATLLPT